MYLCHLGNQLLFLICRVCLLAQQYLNSEQKLENQKAGEVNEIIKVVKEGGIGNMKKS